MKDLLGFIALSIAPLALLAVVVFGLLAAWLATRLTRVTWARWVLGLGAVLSVFLGVTWDEFAGRAHFKQLCATDSGIRIYRKVRLEFDHALANFSGNPADYKDTPLAELYPYAVEYAGDIPGPARIRYVRQTIT